MSRNHYQLPDRVKCWWMDLNLRTGVSLTYPLTMDIRIIALESFAFRRLQGIAYKAPQP